MKQSLVVAAAVLMCAKVVAQQIEPGLGRAWNEAVFANPERSTQTGRGLTPLPSTAYRYEQGEYESKQSRITLKLPRLHDEKVVSVREAIAMRRADGQAATTHVLFVPDAAGSSTDTEQGASAVVVTRSRDDAPKDREAILKQFEPRSDVEKAQFEASGVRYARVDTQLGKAVQRVVLNRAAGEPFPYKTFIDRAPGARTVGVTRYVVIENDSLIEFSQVYPCRMLGLAECQQEALRASDRFVSGVGKFVKLTDVTN